MCSDRHTSQSSRCIYYLNQNYCFKTITQGLASSHYMFSRQFGFLLTGKAAFCSTCYNDSNGRQKKQKGTEAIQLLHCLYFLCHKLEVLHCPTKFLLISRQLIWMSERL